MRNNKIEEEEPAMEFHGLQTYMNAKRSNFFQSTFCSCGADMNWFCTFCDKSLNRKENNAKDTLFSNFAMLSPYFLQVLCVYSGFVASASILLPAWVRSLLQQTSESIYLHPERIVWYYSQWQPA